MKFVRSCGLILSAWAHSVPDRQPRPAEVDGMYQSPWILQELVRQERAGTVRAAARPRPDVTLTDRARADLARNDLVPRDLARRVPRFPRARRAIAEVRIWATPRRLARRTPSTGRVRGALDRAG
jgi:hypothetical protein